MKLVIRGTVTTASHVHQTSPDTKGAHMRTNIAVNGVLVRDVPFITANSVRGLIRRGAAEHVIDCLVKNGVQISRNLYLSMFRGTFGRSAIDSNGAKYTEAANAAKHVFAGLFGGGARMYRSPWRLTRDLMPVLDCTKASMPLAVQEHALAALPHDILVETLMAPRDDFARLPQTARLSVANLEAEYSEHMATKEAQRQNGKNQEGDEKESKDDLDNFAKAQCIIPGVPLVFDIQTEDITPAQAGMLLTGLHVWVNKNALGGGSARGRGAFIPNLSLWVDGKKVADHLFTGEAPMLEFAQSEAIADCLSACSRELEVDLFAKLNEAFPSETDAILEKQKKKADKAASKKTKEAATEAEVA